MKHVSLGSTGVRVSQMCLGTMMFGARADERESDAILGTAIDGAVNFIDTAAMYGEGVTEEILGRILKGRRDRVFITTKVHKGTDGKTVRTSLDESLARMQTDRVDLYMIHWPHEGTRIKEMMEALNDVVKAGKARFVGFCNCPAWLFAHCNRIAAEHGWAQLVCNQVPYNVFERGIEVEILAQADAETIAITTYRALAVGLLTGRYGRNQPAPDNARGKTDARVPAWLAKYGDGLEKFAEFAAGRGMTPAHLATAWVYGRAEVTAPIVGVSSRDQVLAAIEGFKIEISKEERDTISSFFDTEVKEEAGGRFPGLRRTAGLVAR